MLIEQSLYQFVLLCFIKTNHLTIILNSLQCTLQLFLRKLILSHGSDNIGIDRYNLYIHSGQLPSSNNTFSPQVFSVVHVTRSLVLCVCYVDYCLSFCPFFGHCVVCWYPLVSSNFSYISSKYIYFNFRVNFIHCCSFQLL
jgi:hypothetical protein